MFRVWGFVIICVGILSGGAQAADFPVIFPPSASNAVHSQDFDWTGFFIGGEIGPAFAERDFAFWGNAGDGGGRSGYMGGFGFQKGVGASGGSSAGYNYQMQSLVVGLEGDINGSSYVAHSIYGGAVVVNGSMDRAVQVDETSRLPWFGTLRARLGLSWNRALVYGTGGLAYGGVVNTVAVDGTVARHEGVNAGWALGGGLEYGLGEGLSVKAEYLVANLGTSYAAFPLSYGSSAFSNAMLGGIGHVGVSNTLDVFRLGMNWKLY